MASPSLLLNTTSIEAEGATLSAKTRTAFTAAALSSGREHAPGGHLRAEINPQLL